LYQVVASSGKHQPSTPDIPNFIEMVIVYTMLDDQNTVLINVMVFNALTFAPQCNQGSLQPIMDASAVKSAYALQLSA
jgi:hypothetical protein